MRPTRLLLGLSALFVLADATTTWWLQAHGGVEINPLLAAVKDGLGLTAMVFLLLAVKLGFIGLIAAVTARVEPLGLRAADLAMTAIAVALTAAALIPVVWNLNHWPVT